VIKNKIVIKKKIIVFFLFDLKFQTLLNSNYITKHMSSMTMTKSTVHSIFKKHHCNGLGVLIYVDMQIV